MDRQDLTRRCVITALLKLMEDQPFEKITVTEITQKAGVARVSFYRNFESKEDVIRSYLSGGMIAERLAHAMTPRSKEGYYEIACDLYSSIAKSYDKLSLIIKAGLTYLLFEQFERLVVDAYALRDIQADYYVSGYAGAFCAIAIAWLENGCRETPKEVAAVVTGIVFPNESLEERMGARLLSTPQP